MQTKCKPNASKCDRATWKRTNHSPVRKRQPRSALRLNMTQQIYQNVLLQSLQSLQQPFYIDSASACLRQFCLKPSRLSLIGMKRSTKDKANFGAWQTDLCTEARFVVNRVHWSLKISQNNVYAASLLASLLASSWHLALLLCLPASHVVPSGVGFTFHIAPCHTTSRSFGVIEAGLQVRGKLIK